MELDGDEWPLIPVNALGVTLGFSVFTLAKNFRISLRHCFEIQCNSSFLAPLLDFVFFLEPFAQCHLVACCPSPSFEKAENL